jgi:predicted nucleic acid-binding Zn ribbon protein
MPFCANCGKENPPGARFCGNCGTELNTGSGSCAKCGKTLEQNEKFCSSCGTPVKTEPPKPTSQPKPEEPKITKEGRKIISGAPKQNQPVNPPPPIVSQPKKKKRGCLSRIFRLFALLLVLIVALVVVLYFLPDSSPKNEGLTGTNIPGIVDIEPGDVSHLPENRDKTTEQIPAKKLEEGKALKKTAESVEKAFANADTTQIKQVLTETALKNYSGVFKEIQPHMQQYASAFKNRKLISATGVYKVYEFSDNKGNKYTAEFALQPEGEWKLVRF